MEAAAQQAKDQAELNELLIWASARGLLADASELIARGADPLTRDKHGHCPAHYAAAHGHLDVLQYLSAKGADLEVEDPQARLPLHHAAAAGGSIEVLRYLTKNSTWLNTADADDDTVLHLAARRGWVPGLKMLLAGGADVDVPNKRGLSALGEAIAAGHADAAQVLLEAGADAGWRASGYTLLHVAAGLSHVKVLQLLLQQRGCSAAAFVNDCKNSDGASPLHAAALAGCLSAAELLLSKGADASIRGSGDLLAWELVPQQPPAADTPKAAGSQPAQQQLEQLQQLLKQAAGIKGSAASSARSTKQVSSSPAARSAVGNTAGSTAASAAADVSQVALDPVTAYSQRFRELDEAEQARKVDGFSRLLPPVLMQLDFLTRESKEAISQVRRANQLLSVFHAVAALRADEAFQEDASDPEVQAALQELGRTNNLDKYANQRQVVSVANKLKKFHSVMQECGGVKLGLQDLLISPGQSLEDLSQKDAVQIERLTQAASEARKAAAAAICTSKPVHPAVPAATAATGNTPGLGASEIETAEPDTELDKELQKHIQENAASTRQPVDPDSMPFWQRMRYEVVTSFIRALKIMSVVLLVWGVMWCLGLMPWQQDPELLEARLKNVLGERVPGAPPQQQQPADTQGHGEL